MRRKLLWQAAVLKQYVFIYLQMKANVKGGGGSECRSPQGTINKFENREALIRIARDAIVDFLLCEHFFFSLCYTFIHSLFHIIQHTRPFYLCFIVKKQQ